MRIEITGKTSDTEKCIFFFNTFDTDIVLTRFEILTKEKNQRKWRIAGRWDVYDKRNNTIENVVMDEAVRAAAREKFLEYVQVKTWNEFKGKP